MNIKDRLEKIQLPCTVAETEREREREREVNGPHACRRPSYHIISYHSFTFKYPCPQIALRGYRREHISIYLCIYLVVVAGQRRDSKRKEREGKEGRAHTYIHSYMWWEKE